MPGGEGKRVTDKNKKEFVEKATRRRALGGAEQAISAIRAGMGDVIPKNLLSVLLPPEVRLISSLRCPGFVTVRLASCSPWLTVTLNLTLTVTLNLTLAVTLNLTLTVTLFVATQVASIVSGPQGEVDLASLQASIW